MKVGKIIGGLLLVVILVVAGIAYLGLSNINALIKNAVETVGPQVTKTDVSLSAVDFKLTEGRGELHGLVIGNPPGYNSEYAFSLGTVALQVDPVSVTGPVIVIKEILVDGAKLVAEQKDLTKSNLVDLLNNMKGGGKAEAPAPASDSDGGASDVRLMVERFSFVNSSAQVLTQQWGEKTLSLPAVKLKNIGDKTTGVSPEELAQVMLQSVIEQTKKQVSRDLEKRAKAEAEAKLKEKLDEKLSDEDKEKLNNLKSLFGK